MKRLFRDYDFMITTVMHMAAVSLSKLSLRGGKRSRLCVDRFKLDDIKTTSCGFLRLHL